VREEVAGEDNTLFNRTLTAKKEKRMDSKLRVLFVYLVGSTNLTNPQNPRELCPL